MRKGSDSKANAMITISGAISTLLVAIGTLFISKIKTKNKYFFVVIGIFALGITLSTIAMYFFYSIIFFEKIPI